MKHPFPLKEIARQAGVGLATVDRVLHARAGVQDAMAQRVRQAIAELTRQRLQAAPGGSVLVIDLVIDAPQRFSRAVQLALEGELPSALPSAFRIRFHITETARPEDIALTLARVRKRGSHGVLLKAPDHPVIRDELSSCAKVHLPVITLATDLPDTPRLAYIGLDNESAGGMAAWLVAQSLNGRPSAAGAKALVVLSSRSFYGEEQRESGFRQTLARLAPSVGLVCVSEGRGIDYHTTAPVQMALDQHPDISAVYSIGGGNRAILACLEQAKRPVAVFVGHDLDRDNRALLAQGRLSAVIHHDLRQDMRVALRLFLHTRHATPRRHVQALAAASLITRYNIPPDHDAM
ncbi:LacI family DNA-binding transcriptional regulator [Ameyamaea chiangmaiensis]|uniref:LacI family DNA-binding transcriptional regulator n=2 Tax=Ameyamaea chiangmaiensis TaxID=442969 RepID=A0A850PA47_9PROT|nr:LacI family DNA-binding transcriptional regulator [Ameyamaea chiangmaiensis]